MRGGCREANCKYTVAVASEPYEYNSYVLETPRLHFYVDYEKKSCRRPASREITISVIVT